MHDGAPVGVETELDDLWAAVPCPTLVVDPTGVVLTLSASARSLLPDASLGIRLEEAAGWLRRAHNLLVGGTTDPGGVKEAVTSGPLGGRKFDAHAAVLPW